MRGRQVESEEEELRDATSSKAATAEAWVAEAGAGQPAGFRVLAGGHSVTGGSEGAYSDRSLPDDPSHHELPGLYPPHTSQLDRWLAVPPNMHLQQQCW